MRIIHSRFALLSHSPYCPCRDAFGQKFSKVPTLVEGYSNLYAMEIDPSKEADEKELFNEETFGFIKELAMSIPGIDEAMAFAEVMKYPPQIGFSCVILSLRVFTLDS